ncbi:MAG: hypothetical protein H0U52_11885 [Chloroflexi bacterium]|nr:hypothetical protein [Chloroflexota bacterium]
MTRSRRTTSRRPVVTLETVARGLLLIAGCLAVAASVVGPVSAASPSVPAPVPGSAPPSPAPDASPSDEPRHVFQTEVWLDAPIPADTPPGTTIQVGVTIVERDGSGVGRLSDVGASYLLLRPAAGDAEPSRVQPRSDWQGHIRASVRVPEGGPGAIEVGFEGEECRDDGTCQTVEFPFTSAGIGPPAGVPRALLVTATIQPPIEAPVVGRRVALDVELHPLANWDLAQLGLPDRIVAIVGQSGDPDVAAAELRRASAAGTLYQGSVTFPRPGEFAITVAVPGTDGQEDQVIARATSRVTVETQASGASAAEPGDGPSLPAWAWIAGLGAVAIVLGFVITRVFADL